MPLSSDEESCSVFSRRGRQSTTSGQSTLGEAEEKYLECPGEEEEPCITPVYNDKVLNLPSELVSHGLSGISLKHYCGSCLRPEESQSQEIFGGEDSFLDSQFPGFHEEKEASKTMSSMIGMCYTPKARNADPDVIAESDSDARDRPLCLRMKIHDRNSFWNLHRPELCKLTWPYDYVTEAVVTEHLHRHLLSHGPLCAAFHEPEDMLAMLNREFDIYDDLKVLHSPRKLPSDEKSNLKKTPCAAPITNNDIDDCDENVSPMRTSKEEFCITIGKPVRKYSTRDVVKPKSESESGIFWLPEEDEAGEDYPYPLVWTDSRNLSYEYEPEREGAEESCMSLDPTPPEPVGWVEPDFCAMI